MTAGALRERITIQSEASTPDGGGGFTAGWVDVVTVFASVSPQRGGEALEAMQVRDTQLYDVVIRYRTDITSKQRVIWGSRIFNIRAVMNKDERDKYLTLVCEEGVGT